MTSEDIPDWAVEKALKPFHEKHPSAQWSPDRIRQVADITDASAGFCALVLAYAALITQHKERTTDPLLVEARKLVAIRYPASEIASIVATLAGEDDGELPIQNCLAALRRGIEIAKAQSDE